jgi:hypothetical protein
MTYEIYLIDGDASTDLGEPNAFATLEEAAAIIPDLAQAIGVDAADLRIREINAGYDISINDINSSYIRDELADAGITHVRFIAEGGEGENHIVVYGYPTAYGECRVAKTNALPVWEEADLGEFAELLESAEISI